VFIYGNLGMPRMGIGGSGFASTLATAFDFFFYTTVLMLPAYRNKFHPFRNLKIKFDLIKKIYRISLPVSFQNVFILIGFLLFVITTGMIGTEQQAASQAVISTLFISFLPCFGFGIAVQTLVGNNLGSGKFRAAKIYGFETAKIATYYTIVLGIIFISIPHLVLLIITNNQSIISVAKPALRIAGFAQIFYAVGVVLANGLQAAGKTFFVMMSEVITNLFIFVPLAYLMGVVLGGGLIWAWLALPVYILLYSLIIYKKYAEGKWQKKTI
jgi:Na+-driven multidrug efflux pump